MTSETAFTKVKYVPTRPEGNAEGYGNKEILKELRRCAADSHKTRYGLVYWIINYVFVFNNDAGGLVPFKLWDTDVEYDNQLQALEKFVLHNRVISLKARQVGMTTLALAYFLYCMLFRPKAYILILSRGEQEAKELLEKLKNMYESLPSWMRSETLVDNNTEWRLKNGSVALSLSSHKGDSYSATHVLIDEAALLYRSKISLKQVLLNLAPTVGLSGKMFLISKADKNRPESTFNSMYRGADRGKTEYVASFIPYDVVPGRTEAWYEKQEAMSKTIDGSLDFLFETYPRSPKEALLPKSVNKRFNYTWLDRCFVEKEPILQITAEGEEGDPEAIDAWNELGMERKLPAIPGIRIYELPLPGETYYISGDPGEGNTSSDDSALNVFREGEGGKMFQVLAYNEKVEPAIFASYLDMIGQFYNQAYVLYELNEHGRAVDLWMHDNSDLNLLRGWAATEKSRKPGWTQNSASKPLAFHNAVDYLREGRVEFYDEVTYTQLSTIESGTNKAPEGMHDDMSMAFVLGLAAHAFCAPQFSFDTIKIHQNPLVRSNNLEIFEQWQLAT